MMKKRMMFLLSIVLILIAVTACVSGTGDINSGGSAAEEKEEPAAVTELTFWHSMDGSYLDIVNAQVEAFNNSIGVEKGIHVSAVYNDWPGTESLVTAMANNDIKNMPDVIQLYNESVSLVRNYERIIWAEDQFAKDSSSVKKSDILENALASFAIDGKSIGVPYNISALLLYYNKTFMEAAGYEAPPATIAEMAEMLPVITSKTDAEYGLNVCIQSFELNNYIATQGSQGTYFGNNASGHNGYMTELACADDGSLMAFLTEWKKVIDSGAYKPVKDSYNEEFATGINAMLMTSSSRINSIGELVDGKFEWGVAPIPTVAEGDIGGAYSSGGGLFMIDRDDSSKADAAWEFVQYMISAEAQMMWANGTGYVPVNVGTVELEEYKNITESNPRVPVAYNVLLGSSAQEVGAFCPASDSVDTIIKEAMIAFSQGGVVEDVYRAITDGSNGAMDAYYRVNPIE